MARDRLSWDKEKSAEIDKKADPYTMNQDHPNPPASKYDIGGPSQFAEDPDMAKPWKTEGRTETGHPAPAARQAVKAARQLEDKALKCITVAQRMLPGASDELIEDQATDLMYIPENRIMATLERQASFAEVLASDDEEDKDEPKEEEKEAKKEDSVEKEEKDAPKPLNEEPEEGEKAAKKDEEEPKEEEEGEEKEAKKEEPEEEEGEEKEAKEEPKEAKEEPKASDEIDLNNPGTDLLDAIFASEETEKTGAKKLSGIVKKASTDTTLDNLWEAPPDVSEAFK